MSKHDKQCKQDYNQRLTIKCNSKKTPNKLNIYLFYSISRAAVKLSIELYRAYITSKGHNECGGHSDLLFLIISC